MINLHLEWREVLWWMQGGGNQGGGTTGGELEG